MKSRFTIFVLVLFCFVVFSACKETDIVAFHETPKEETISDTEENISVTDESENEIAYSSTEDNISDLQPKDEESEEENNETDTNIFPIQFSSSPPRNFIPPPVAVVPLTSTGAIYKHVITGETVFIRRDGSRVELPQNVSWYNVVYDRGDASVVGYVLTEWRDRSDATYMFMDTSGNITFNFHFNPDIDETGNAASYESRHGYMVINSDTDENWHRKNGLVDLTTGQIVIEPVYNWLSLLPSLIYARRDGNYYFLDYSGEILFDFGERRVGMIGENGYSLSMDDGYTFLIDIGELHKGHVDVPRVISQREEHIEKRGDLRIRNRFEQTEDRWHIQLEDENSNIIIPFGVYDILALHSPFVFGYPAEYFAIGSGNNNLDVLNIYGELLEHNPLGAIYEAHFPDAMVVWLDEETCILLEPSGNRTLIENSPIVKSRYQGG
jgi:hypothetical protein